MGDISGPRVWDCVTYFDELDHLQARFEMLRYVVDGHIVCEGDATHQGDPKPLHLDGVDLPDNVIRLSAWLSRFGDVDPWMRERAQRDYIGTYVARMEGDLFAPDDILMVCDVDEHVNPEAVQFLDSATRDGPVFLAMRMLYYGLDWELPGPSDTFGPWWHPRALRVRDLPRSLSALRLGEVGLEVERGVAGAGWHVSYTGGPERRAAKLRAYAHAENNTVEGHARIATAHETGIGPNGEQLVRVTDHEGIPEALVRRFG